MKTILLFLLSAIAARAEILRLSLVAQEAGVGITGFEFGEGEDVQTLLVVDEAIVSDADIEQAMPSPSREDSVDISLSPEGTRKMMEATGKMRPNIDRIAIVLEGKILSAPVLQSVPLGKNFVISGLDGKDERLKLASRLSGKSEQEIANEIEAREERLRNLPPPPKPVFHTEEEFQELKAERERIGLHFMDRVYSEAELDRLLAVGMKEEEVTAIFGKPNKVKRKKGGPNTLRFETAPERLPAEPVDHIDSFVTNFSAGKLTGWKAESWSKRTRAAKPMAGDPGNLIIKPPPADMSSQDFDLISFHEEFTISLKPGKTEPSKADLNGLLGLLWTISNLYDDGQSIDLQCDILEILIPHVPELKGLVGDAKRGRIGFAEIEGAIQPYIYGEKDVE